jgi:hypothetical protein
MLTRRRQGREPASGREARARRGAGLLVLLAALGVSGCAPVRPEQRAILADRIMQFGADGHARAALEHALENREGSSGGGSVKGGGCGCN